MTGMLRIFRYELQRQWRRGGYLLTTFGIPAIALLIFFGAQFYQERIASQQTQQNDGPDLPPGINLPGASTATQIGVVDLSGLIRQTNNPILVLYPTEAEAQQALDADKIGYYYKIAPDYLTTGNVDMVFQRVALGNVDSRQVRRLLVENMVAASGQEVDPALVGRLFLKPQIVTSTVSATGSVQQTGGFDTNFMVVYVFALVLLIVAFTTSGYLMQSVVEEKETRMVEVLISSVRPRDLLIGKVLALSLLGLIQMAVWTATVYFIMTQLAGGAIQSVTVLLGFSLTATQLIVIVVFFLLGYLMYAAAFAVVGTIATNMREGPQLAAVVTLPAAVPLWATSLFATAPNSPVAIFLSLFPPTAPLSMVMRATVSQVPFEQVAISVALLVLTVLGLMWLAGRVFRVNILLSGQLPKLRDLGRLITEKV